MVIFHSYVSLPEGEFWEGFTDPHTMEQTWVQLIRENDMEKKLGSWFGF